MTEKKLKCDTCEIEQENNLVNIDYSVEQGQDTKWICKYCTDKRFINKYSLILEEHNTQENAFIVENYPYGFKRTLKKYWIETTKRGDRLATQTLNPKTNQWNNPKKSTYEDVMVLIKNKENGHIHRHSWAVSYTYLIDLEQFLSFTEGYKFNSEQELRLKQGRAIYKTRDEMHKIAPLKLEVVYFKHRETGEIKTQVGIFDLNKVDKCTKDGVLIDEKKEEAKQKEVKRVQNAVLYKNLKEEGL